MAKTPVIKLTSPNVRDPEKFAKIQASLKVSQKEEKRSFASRFAEELGFRTKELGKEILQGTARSLGSLGQIPLTGKIDEPITRPKDPVAGKAFDLIFGERFAEKGVDKNYWGRFYSIIRIYRCLKRNSK